MPSHPRSAAAGREKSRPGCVGGTEQLSDRSFLLGFQLLSHRQSRGGALYAGAAPPESAGRRRCRTATRGVLTKRFSAGCRVLQVKDALPTVVARQKPWTWISVRRRASEIHRLVLQNRVKLGGG